MKDDSINLAEQMNSGKGPSITLRVEDLEQLGPALLIDHSEQDGSRFVVWTE